MVSGRSGRQHVGALDLPAGRHPECVERWRRRELARECGESRQPNCCLFGEDPCDRGLEVDAWECKNWPTDPAYCVAS